MANQSNYNKLTMHEFKGHLYLTARNRYIDLIIKKLINENIISTKFIDDLMKIDYVKQNMKKKQKNQLESQPLYDDNSKNELIITDDARHYFMKKTFIKECNKTMCKLISELSQV